MAGKVSNKLKPIKYLTVTHDSKYLFVYDTSIRVFSLESKEEELKFPIKNEILITMAVSRNNQQFFASSEAGHIFSFPLHEENNIKVLDRIDKSVSNISISNDNRYIAATFNDRRVRLIDLEEQTSTYLQHEKIITGIIFSDDSNLLISSLQDSKLRIKTLDGSRTDTAIQAPKGEIKHIASTSDLFLTTCGERTINLWSMGNNSCVKTMHVGCDKISAALFSSDNEYIVIIADSDLQI